MLLLKLESGEDVAEGDKACSGTGFAPIFFEVHLRTGSARGLRR